MRSTTLLVLCALGFSAAADPAFTVEPIFPLQDKHVHASSIVEDPNGDLLACWFHGSGERTANDVVIQGARKKKGAEAWGPVFLMADTPDLPDCNPVLFVDPQERLWLFWAAVVANGWEHALLKYRRAETWVHDGPPTWSWQDVIILKPGDPFPEAIERGFRELGAQEGCWGTYAPPYEEMLVEAARDPVKRQKGWMPRIHPLVLPTGRILLPLYSDGFNLSLIAISDDAGDTWRASLPIVGYGPTQPSLVLKKDGTVVAYLRDEGNPPQRVQFASSGDGGESWSTAVDIDIPNPSSSLEVIALNDGRWLMIGNDTEEGRHRLTARLSDDEGASWKWKRQLEPADAAGKSFGYPSLIQARDGRIHVTYSKTTDAGATIAHAQFNADWVVREK
ncbi:MAG: sialidase family protein [Candidatus Hydrogenedentales bacterium]|jgi:predicted neuraminidase